MPTDFWGVVIPNYLAASTGIGALVVAILALNVSRGAREDAKKAIDADADTREAVAIVAGTLNATTPGVTVGPPTVEWEGKSTPPARTPEDQRRLDEILATVARVPKRPVDPR